MGTSFSCPFCAEHRSAAQELGDALLDVIAQACEDAMGQFDSMGISSNAEAMRLLAQQGRLEIVAEDGRRVIARRVQK